jgi:F0F1-type ATP synthase membrane subunit c/vacuolar-type H+-ATPase subunit K
MDVRMPWQGFAAALCVLAMAGAASAQQSAPGGFLGFSGQRWSTDYGITQGRCDQARILLVTGDARRDLVAEHEAHVRNRTVGVIGAPGSGMLLSTHALRSGARPDARDRACIGHVLELGSVGRGVGWINAATRTRYLATLAEEPARASRLRCRVLLLTAVPALPGVVPVAGRGPIERFVACETGGGVWSLR